MSYWQRFYKNIGKEDIVNKEYPYLETPEAQRERLVKELLLVQQKAIAYSKQPEENRHQDCQNIKEEKSNPQFYQEEKNLKSGQENSEQNKEIQRQQQQEPTITSFSPLYIPVSTSITPQNRSSSNLAKSQSSTFLRFEATKTLEIYLLPKFKIQMPKFQMSKSQIPNPKL